MTAVLNAISATMFFVAGVNYLLEGRLVGVGFLVASVLLYFAAFARAVGDTQQ